MFLAARSALSGIILLSCYKLMACPELVIESGFNKMRGTVDSYSMNNITMTLNKAGMAPRAKFKAVVMK